MKSFNAAAEPQPESWTPLHTGGPEQEPLPQGSLFSGKSFLLVGFGVEAEAQLSALLKEQGGRLLLGRSRVVADFAVVPQLGCTVEATVDEVVTDTWLVRTQFVFCFIFLICPAELHSCSDLFIAGYVCGERARSAAVL